MSTTIIVAIIAVGLFVLVAVAVVLQTIEKNNKEKRRIEGTLNTRARNFEYMLQGFPEGFLNKDLQILVCNCLEEVFNQLLHINSKNKEYRNKLEKNRLKTADFQNLPSASGSITLTDNVQIKEIQKMLGGLYSFISKLAASGRINTEQAKIYGKQVRRLMLQTSIDGLIEPIKGAIAKGKPQLAIHYLHMANNKMKKENDDGFYTDRINKQAARISDLEQQANQLENADQTTEHETDEEWNELNKPDDSWKKNAVYD